MSANPLLARNPHPGKFEGEPNLTEKLYDVFMDGGADEEIGDEGFGNYLLFTDLDKDSELGHLEGIVAAILRLTDQGFVEGTYYEDMEYARKVWRNLEKQWEKHLEATEGEY
jgi:hypothetical protein